MVAAAEVRAPHTTLFYIDEQRAAPPQPPTLMDGVIGLIGDQIPHSLLKGPKSVSRSGSRDLIIQRTEPASIACLMHSLAPYQAFIGQEFVDLPLIIRAVESSSHPLEGGIVIVTPYMELRDDAQFRDASPNADTYADLLVQSDTFKKIIAITLWDPHSAKGADILRHNFEKRNRLVHLYNFTAMKSFADAFRADLDIETKRDNYIVVAPDAGSLHRSMLLAEELGLPVALFDKTRPDVGDVEFGNLYIAGRDGKAMVADENIIRGKKVLIFDDLYATTKTAVISAERLKKKYGVSEIHFAATHAAYIMPDADNYLGKALREKTLDSAYVTDTLPSCRMIEGVKVVSLAYPTALIIKAASGMLNDREMAKLQKYYFVPGPPKDIFKTQLANGDLDLTPGRWPWRYSAVKSQTKQLPPTWPYRNSIIIGQESAQVQEIPQTGVMYCYHKDNIVFAREI